MKNFRLWQGVLLVLLCLTSRLVFAQDAPEPTANRPPLVDCVEGETIPCSVIVDEVSDIAGVWRGYIEAGSAMGFIVINNDGSFGTTRDPQAEPTLNGSITFTDGLAFVTANDDGSTPAECVTTGVYIMRLIRLGEQPLALTRRPQKQDNCAERAADFSEPMLSYSGSGQELPMLDEDVNPLAQALVPCPPDTVDAATAYPCDVVATQPSDIAGVWNFYLVPPLTGSAFIRYSTDNRWLVANTAANTAAPSSSFGVGMFEFDQAQATIHEPGDSAECIRADYYLHVIRWGNQPVALSYSPIKDDCDVRRSAWTDPMLWISGG